MIDPVKNFAIATTSTGYNASAVSIVLTAGGGAMFPDPSTDGEFNLTWYNSTDYSNPADDPNKEIVRVTAISTNTLTVTRAAEGTTASTKNTASKTYKMLLAITKKTIDDIESGKQDVLAGGAEDDLLIKQSATDGDAAWEDSDTHKIRKTYYSDTEPAGLADGDIWVDTSVEIVDTPIEGQTEEYDNSNSGTSKTIDWGDGRHQKITLNDDVTLTFTDPEFVGWYNLRIIQDGTGGHDITLPSGVITPTALPDFATMNADQEILLGVRFDGTNYLISATEIYGS